MIKNKTLNIKFIFKILKTSLKHFKFQDRFLFYKNQRTTFKNCSQKLFSIIIFENNYHIG